MSTHHLQLCVCSCSCRLRDAEAAAAKAAAELSKQQAARMAGIAAVLESEEKEYQKQLARQEFDRQVGCWLLTQVDLLASSVD
jgi:hypothetical protein